MSVDALTEARRPKLVTRTRDLLRFLAICVLAADPLVATAQTTTLPTGWATTNIGAPAVAGSATYSQGVFTVKGGGMNICCASDQFRYVYRAITGDTQIVAHVATLQVANPWSKAGVMIRAALTGSSSHAFMFVSPWGSVASPWGSVMRSRLSAGSSSVETAMAAVTPPYWVRLVREGNVFTAYRSKDGSHWTLVGAEAITMPATVYVGLAVTSFSASAPATARFSNVTISTPTGGNKPPTVSISSPLTGAGFTAPANIPIAAIAGDVDGSITGVSFYAGTQLLGSDSTYPFAISWSNVPAGQVQFEGGCYRQRGWRDYLFSGYGQRRRRAGAAPNSGRFRAANELRDPRDVRDHSIAPRW